MVGREARRCRRQGEQNTEERILDLLPPTPAASKGSSSEEIDKAQETFQKTREKLRQQLRDGKLDERSVEVEVRERSFPFRDHFQLGCRRNGHQCQDMLPGLFGQKTKKRKMKISRRLIT
jgi:ATP-dependent HslUV protease ATP-binding subunit HslU